MMELSQPFCSFVSNNDWIQLAPCWYQTEKLNKRLAVWSWHGLEIASAFHPDGSCLSVSGVGTLQLASFDDAIASMQPPGQLQPEEFRSVGSRSWRQTPPCEMRVSPVFIFPFNGLVLFHLNRGQSKHQPAHPRLATSQPPRSDLCPNTLALACSYMRRLSENIINSHGHVCWFWWLNGGCASETDLITEPWRSLHAIWCWDHQRYSPRTAAL